MSTPWALPRVALLMGPGYSDEQAGWIVGTALANPGVPVVFDGHGGGKEQVTRTNGGWEITGAA